MSALFLFTVCSYCAETEDTWSLIPLNDGNVESAPAQKKKSEATQLIEAVMQYGAIDTKKKRKLTCLYIKSPKPPFNAEQLRSLPDRDAVFVDERDGCVILRGRINEQNQFIIVRYDPDAPDQALSCIHSRREDKKVWIYSSAHMDAPPCLRCQELKNIIGK